MGSSDGILGKLFFPLGDDVEIFESFGWPGKPQEPSLADDENRDLQTDENGCCRFGEGIGRCQRHGSG